MKKQKKYEGTIQEDHLQKLREKAMEFEPKEAINIDEFKQVYSDYILHVACSDHGGPGNALNQGQPVVDEKDEIMDEPEDDELDSSMHASDQDQEAQQVLEMRTTMVKQTDQSEVQ